MNLARRARLITALIWGFVVSATNSFIFIANEINNAGLGIASLSPAVYILCVLALWLIFSFVAYILLKYISPFFKWVQKMCSHTFNKLPLTWSWRNILILTAVLFVIWIPNMISQYPGYMDIDTVQMVAQFATDAPVDYSVRAVPATVDAKYITHDPLFDTLLFGVVWMLDELLGGCGAGFFIYVILQSLFTALMLSMSCLYLNRLNLPKSSVFFAYLFVLLMPIFMRTAASIQKDSIFAPCFLAFLIGYIEAFRTKGEAFSNKKFCALFFIFALLTMLTKKTGLPIVAVSIIVMLIVLKRKRIACAVSGLIPVVLVAFILPAIFYPLLGVAKIGTQEALGVFFQQTAEVVKTYPGDVTEEEKEAIDAVLDFDSLAKNYNPHLTDPVKNTYKMDASTEDLLNYLKVYIAQGLRHPIDYLYALALTNGGLFAPVDGIDLHCILPENCVDWVAQHEGEFHMYEEQPETILAMNHAFGGVFWYYYDCLGLFGRVAFYSGWLSLLAVVSVFVFAKGRRWMLLPIALSVLTLIVSPCVYTRYMVGILYSAPLLFALILWTQQLADAPVGLKPQEELDSAQEESIVIQ